MQETMNRTPHERFIFFLHLCEEMQFFYSDVTHPNLLKKNFVIE